MKAITMTITALDCRLIYNALTEYRHTAIHEGQWSELTDHLQNLADEFWEEASDEVAEK